MSGWKIMTDIEEDGDCVDGASLNRPTNPREYFTPTKPQPSYHFDFHLSKRFGEPRTDSISSEDGQKLLSLDQHVDSGLDSDFFESYKSETDLGCPSIGEFAVEFKNQLKIEPESQPPTSPNSSTKRKVEEESCRSVDEAYFSGGQLNSNTNSDNFNLCTSDIEAAFCEQNNEGDTQSHLCLIHGKTDLFLLLLSLVPSASLLNVTNLLQQSLLHLAVILKLPQIVRRLVARGAAIDPRDRSGNTPLHVACTQGNLESVLSLTTPLEPREVKTVPYSVGYQRIPQDQDIMNYDGLTCLHVAASGGHINIVNHLITKCYADINAQEGRGGETVLHQAVESNNTGLVKYLLLHRELHIDSTRYDGSTALSLAKGRMNIKMINLLVNAGATDLSFLSDQNEDDTNSVDDSAEECDSMDSEFSYDDFKIGGSEVSI